MKARIRLHPGALERLRARSGRTAISVLHDAGIAPEEFLTRIADQSFTAEQLAGLARALQSTPRELLTASTVRFTKECLDARTRRST